MLGRGAVSATGAVIALALAAWPRLSAAQAAERGGAGAPEGEDLVAEHLVAEDLVGRRLQPRDGELWLGVSLELDSSQQRAGSVAVAPDLRWGLDDDTTVALTHSSASIARIGKIGGLCLTACEHRPGYAVAALLQRRLVAAARLELSALAGGLVRDVGPWKPAALAGASARWHRGRFGIEGTAYLQLGLANAEQGNRHRVVFAARVWVQPTCRWALGLHSGAEGELEVFTEAYHVPVVALLATQLSPRVTLTGEIGLPRLLGPQNTARDRHATLAVELRR